MPLSESSVLETVLKFAQTGGWGVSVLVIYLWFRSNDKKHEQDREEQRMRLEEKQKEQEYLLKVIQGNTEAVTKLTGLIENQSKILDKQSELLTSLQIKMAKFESR